MNHNNIVSLPVGATALVAHMRVRLASGLVVPAGAADLDVIGHVLQDTPVGGTADIATRLASGEHYAIAAGVIANGALCGGAANGQIATGGTECVALSAASGAGSIIRVIYVGNPAGPT